MSNTFRRRRSTLLRTCLAPLAAALASCGENDAVDDVEPPSLGFCCALPDEPPQGWSVFVAGDPVLYEIGGRRRTRAELRMMRPSTPTQGLPLYTAEGCALQSAINFQSSYMLREEVGCPIWIATRSGTFRDFDFRDPDATDTKDEGSETPDTTETTETTE